MKYPYGNSRSISCILYLCILYLFDKPQFEILPPIIHPSLHEIRRNPPPENNFCSRKISPAFCAYSHGVHIFVVQYHDTMSALWQDSERNYL